MCRPARRHRCGTFVNVKDRRVAALDHRRVLNNRRLDHGQILRLQLRKVAVFALVEPCNGVLDRRLRMAGFRLNQSKVFEPFCQLRHAAKLYVLAMPHAV